MSEELKHVTEIASVQSLSRDRHGYTYEQLTIIRESICGKDFTDAEFLYFINVCKSKNLDPLSRQIYAFKQNGKVVIIIAIDGFRSIAHSSGSCQGIEGPYWFDKDGNEKQVWTSKEPPLAAIVRVYKENWIKPVEGVVYWDEYNKGVGNWSKMPKVMLGKCAEAVAIRKAFPQQLSGVYSHEEIEVPSLQDPFNGTLTSPKNHIKTIQPQTIDIQPIPAAEELPSLRERCRETFILMNKVGDFQKHWDSKMLQFHKTGDIESIRQHVLDCESRATTKHKLLNVKEEPIESELLTMNEEEYEIENVS